MPLSAPDAITLAERQTRALADFDVPLLLFLDRIGDFRIDVKTPDGRRYRRRLTRSQRSFRDVPGTTGCRLYEVGVGQDRRFLVVQREVDKALVLRAVKESISRAPQLKRWLDWKGQPTVSVAVGLSHGAVAEGRLYNFLPMGDAAPAPLLGHLDAPFFAGIDRRRADLDLPLNAVLLEAAAEASARAALHIARKADTPTLQRAVFDLFAWTGPHAGKLDAALDGMGSSLKDARVVPVIPVDRCHWSSLSGVHVWPAGRFSLMKALEVARRAGAQLVSTVVDEGRRERLEAMAKRIHWNLRPSGERLAEWSESFARSLAERNAKPRTWSRFYNDLGPVFRAAGANLRALAGKRIMLDRSKRLRAAGVDGASGRGVFVRTETPRRTRTKGGVPLPPATLARRYRFVDEKIRFRRETLNALLEADLVREYDPVEALSGLASALGARANDNRRREALTWAFRVWGAKGGTIEDALRNAELWVPTLSGWQPATQAAYSSSWTPVGRILENFLMEATDTSPDCRRAREGLLVDFSDWPMVPGGSKRRWVEFLALLGVSDGLRPVPGKMLARGEGWRWGQFVRKGVAEEALDEDWCKEASLTSFRHPYTVYQRKGEAWRFPGQMEHEELPEGAKEMFHELAFRHLEAQGAEFLTFDVGRFERTQPYWDKRNVPTPLATFLRSRAWVAVGAREEPAFRSPHECWAAKTRRQRPPRFVDRLPDALAGLVEGSEDLSKLVFGTLGLRDWHDEGTATERLEVLAAVAPALAGHDRPAFRREYRRAWFDVAQTDAVLPADLSLAVSRDGRYENLSGDAATPTTVILAQGGNTLEASMLSSAGHALLDIGDASSERIADQLDATGRFVPRQLGGTDVKLLVDGEPFVPSAADPFLTSIELEWLPETVILGHQMLAEQLERGVLPITVERRVRAIRVRHCRTIKFVVDEAGPSPKDRLEFYGFEHPEFPTLVLSDRMPLTWTTLGRDLSRPISRLIDTRLRFLESLLPRLALGQEGVGLDAPSDEALAKALRCDAQTLQEHRAALQTDLGHVLHLLTPVVAYFGGTALARQFEDDAERSKAEFDVRDWLCSRFPPLEFAPINWLSACEQSSDRAAVRRVLDLDYKRFNRTLLALDERPLSNEAHLRSLYDAYLRGMGPAIVDRLRRRHVADFREGRDLGAYVERKKLTFLAFDPEWIQTKETLEQRIVESHVLELLDEVLGEDVDVSLQSLRSVSEANRKAVRNFASRASSVVLAWCHRAGAPVPEHWSSKEPQAVARHLENAGLLDFERIDDAQLPELCLRSACWPETMPRTLDTATLGIDQSAVDEEERRRETERQRMIVDRRSVCFGGTRLDTGDLTFPHAFLEVAEESLRRDDSWWARSRSRPRLAEVRAGGQTRGAGPGGGTRRAKRPHEDQRRAMGLASEWLAFQYLRRRHRDVVDETCWVSTNRVHFFGGSEGDDAAGYDFCVKTPQAEWMYEVKSSVGDTGEFELTPNEMRVAARMPKRGRRRYRILYVPFVFSPERWMVLELPNPLGDDTRNRFKQIGRGSVRFKFEHSTAGARRGP